MDVVERSHAGPPGQCGRRQSEGHGHLQVGVHHVGAAASDERDQPRHGGGIQRAADTEVLRLQADLAALDADYRAGLRSCTTRTLVVSHDAFEYLGARYDLDVHAIAGLSPDAEPSARHLSELADLIRTDHITTVFNERLASPKLAETLAGDLGIRTAVLDPTDPEPLPADHPLWSAPNCLVTMHLSGRSQTAMFRRAAALFLENLDAFRDGRPMRNVANLARGY